MIYIVVQSQPFPISYRPLPLINDPKNQSSIPLSRNERKGKGLKIHPSTRANLVNTSSSRSIICPDDISDKSSKPPVVARGPVARSFDLTWLMSVAVSLMLMMMMLIHGDSFAPAMAIACVAYEDGLFLDAKNIDITLVSRILSDRRRRHFALCSTIPLTRGRAVPAKDKDRSSGGGRRTCRRRSAR